MFRQSKPFIQASKIIGLVILPVLLIRMVLEKVLYLSRFNSFLPGDLFLALAVFFANRAQRFTLPSRRISYRSSTKVMIGIVAALFVGLGQGLMAIKNGQSWGVFLLPSQLYHMIGSYGFGGYIVSEAFLPLFHIKWSINKVLAFFFLALYIGMLPVDSLLGDTSHDFTVAGWQSQRLIVDFRK